jgi:hypothetical protein
MWGMLSDHDDLGRIFMGDLLGRTTKAGAHHDLP